MAQEQSVSQLIPPASLFLGPEEVTTVHTEQHLQKIFCPHKACNVCLTCEQIRKRQHHAVMWLVPEKNYTVDDVEDIFQVTSLALNPDDYFFFILEKADFLTTASANKLLKVLEEPPRGYHFILCAQRGDALLPTIISRCITTSFFLESHKKIHEKLFHYFITGATTDPSEFLKELEASKINEQESLELLDTILQHWTRAYKDALEKNDSKQQDEADTQVALFAKALLQPPMPGSSKIFWKNLFLQAE